MMQSTPPKATTALKTMPNVTSSDSKNNAPNSTVMIGLQEAKMQTSVKENHLIVIWISMVIQTMCPTATVHFQKLTVVHERSKFPFSSRRY